MHQKWCKKVKENDAKGEVLNLPKKKVVDSVDKDVAFALEDLVDKVCQTNTSLTEVRRGSVGLSHIPTPSNSALLKKKVAWQLNPM